MIKPPSEPATEEKTSPESARASIRERLAETKRDEFERRKRGVGPEACKILDSIALLACLPFRLPVAAAVLDGDDALAQAHLALERLCACGLLVKSETADGERRWRFADPAFHSYARCDHREETDSVPRLIPAIRAAAESEFARGAKATTMELSMVIEHASTLLQHGPPEPQWKTIAEWMLYPAREHLAALGQCDNALSCLAAVDEWWGRLSPALKASASWRRERCMMLMHRADLYTQKGELLTATRTQEEAAALARELSDEAPSPAALRRLQMILEKLADLYTATGNVKAAGASYAEMQSLSEKLDSDAAEASGDQQRQALTSLLALGDAEYRRGHSTAACAAYEEARRLARGFADGTAPSDEAMQDIYLTLSKLGRAQTACDNHVAACETFAEACRIADQARTIHPEDSTWESRLEAMLSRLGDAHLALGDGPSATKAYERDLELVEKAHTARPDDPAVQRGLSSSLLKLGHARAFTGDFEAAQRNIERACALRQTLLANSPDDLDRKRDLLVAFTQAGSLHVAAGTNDKAMSLFQSALKLAEELCAAEPANSGRQADRALLREQLALLSA